MRVILHKMNITVHKKPKCTVVSEIDLTDKLTNSLHNLKILYDAGIPIAMGTDNMFETMSGDVEHRKLAYYVEAGLTPMQAIVLATKNGAEHLGISDRKGPVRCGMEGYEIEEQSKGTVSL